jgi:hypothetical protein
MTAIMADARPVETEGPAGARRADLPVLAFRSVSRVAPLSYQQETYLEAEQQRGVGYRRLDTNARVTNAFGAFRVQGPLNRGVLRRSLNEVLRRHDALRTRFEVRDHGIVQIVTDADEVPLERAGARDLSAAARLAAEAALRPFDFEAGLLLRVHAIHLADHDTIVVLVVPHVIADAASVQVVIDETVTLYAHFVHGLPSPLNAPEVQYADYVRWQREWVRGDVLTAVRRDVIAGLTGARPLQLPVGDGCADAEVGATDAAEVRFALDAETLAGVKAASGAQRVTPFVVMLSAFNVLLAEWSGKTDVLLLAPFAARPDRSTQKVIGLFSNLWPIRIDLSGQPRFADVLEQVQESVLRAMQYRCVPHAVLAETLRGQGDISCTGVGVNAVPDGGKVMPRGCRALLEPAVCLTPYVVSTSELAVRQMRGHLSFWIGFAADGGITGRLVYRRASFDEAVMRQVAQSFVARLAALVTMV